jgi:hypothetical protein
VSEETIFFNTTARRLGESVTRWRPPSPVARMRRHAEIERNWREDKITGNLEGAWRRAIAEFKARDDAAP